LTEDEDVLS